MTPPPTGWPFLIAAGRHRDYSILLAPDFLVRDLDYGFLDDTVKPGNGQPRVVNVRTRAGRHLTVVSATHMLTPVDAPATHDEHGRPMRLLYGFVCGHLIVEPDPADLAATLTVALDAYRRFLDNEDAPVVVAGQPFALRSAVIRQMEPVSARAPDPAVGCPPRWRTRAAVSIIGAAVAVALALVLWPRTEAPAPCPTATVTVGPTPTTVESPPYVPTQYRRSPLAPVIRTPLSEGRQVGAEADESGGCRRQRGPDRPRTAGR